MATMTTNTDNQLELSVDITGSTKSYLLATATSYLEKDIKFKINVPTVGAATLNITDNNSDVTVGTAAEGKYLLTNSLTGTMTFASAGWITTNGDSATDTTVQVGKIAQSTLVQGSTAISSGATVNPTASTQTINITAGYEAARTIKVGPISAGPKGVITSGTASLGALTYTYNTTNENFDISGTATISAATVGTAGYMSVDDGAKNGNSNTVTQTVDKVTVGTIIASGSAGTVTPVISRTAKPNSDTWTDAANGDATGTKPVSGVYVQVDAPAVAKSVSVQGTVTAAGYGTADYHIKETAQSITMGSAAALTKYIPITTSSVAVTGGALNNKSSSATFTNATTSNSNTSGIVIQTKGTAGRAKITYNQATNGWVTAAAGGDVSGGGAVSTSTWDGTAYYLTGVTVAKPTSSGSTNTFLLTLPNGSDTMTLTITADNSGNVTIT